MVREFPFPAAGQNDFRTPHFENRLSQFWTTLGTADIVMLGDSITEFGEWHELLPGFSVINRGISGDTSYGVLARLDEIIQRKPKVVVLMVGVNDLAHGFPVQDVAHKISLIVSRVAAHFIVADVICTADQSANEKIQELNSMLHDVKTADHFDLNRVLCPQHVLTSKYSADGVHLNGAAFAIWRDQLIPLLNGVLKRD